MGSMVTPIRALMGNQVAVKVNHIGGSPSLEANAPRVRLGLRLGRAGAGPERASWLDGSWDAEEPGSPMNPFWETNLKLPMTEWPILGGEPVMRGMDGGDNPMDWASSPPIIGRLRACGWLWYYIVCKLGWCGVV